MNRAHEFDSSKLTYGSDNEESRLPLRELILFIAERCQDDPSFGVTKLNKILFYCDFMAFAKFGEPITGVPYNKLPYGPVPTGAENARRQMANNEEIFVASEGYSPFRAKRIVPLREADLTLFSGPEVALVDGIIEAFSGATAATISDISHGKAWQAVEYNDPIPYEAALLSNDQPTEEDIARARELVALGDLED